MLTDKGFSKIRMREVEKEEGKKRGRVPRWRKGIKNKDYYTLNISRGGMNEEKSTAFC